MHFAIAPPSFLNRLQFFGHGSVVGFTFTFTNGETISCIRLEIADEKRRFVTSTSKV